ncbi:MAG TPA: toll/interleukin-1 receptor domain-containing protein [Telluria sp.]|jgi:hypothetical protein
MAIPKVFISYSHDDQAHKKWVLDLATRLRNTGIDAVLDQWELRPGDDLPAFMEKNLREADRVVMVCSENYVAKANSGTGGVGYEKMIVTSDLMQGIDSNKVIPIIRQEGTQDVPTFLKTKLFINFSRSDDLEFAFDELVRTIHGAPLYVKPPVGNNPFQAVEEVAAEKTSDPIKDLVAYVVRDYEGGASYTLYRDLIADFGISRILLDVLIQDVQTMGLIKTDNDGDLYLTSKGKHYAVEHRLIMGG